MSEASLESWVARLEEQMDRLAQIGRPTQEQPGRDEWMESVGMFRGDPIVKEMIDETARARAEEHLRALDDAKRCSP